jgi:membrane-associated phospholipid phosphatase
MRRWAGRPLLGTGRARRLAWGLLVACVVVVAVFGATFAHQAAADGFDRVADHPVIASLGRDRTLALWMTEPGTQLPAALLSLAMAVACLRARWGSGVVLALAADFVATRIDDWFLKSLVGRTYLGALSYPSGHTTSVVTLTATYLVLFVIAPQPARGRRMRRWGVGVALVLVASTATGVVALSWHYFTDTVGGAAVGVATVCGMSLLLDGRRWSAAKTEDFAAESGNIRTLE